MIPLPAVKLRFKNIHGRRTDKAGDKYICRVGIYLFGVPICWTNPRDMTTMRVAIVIAQFGRA